MISIVSSDFFNDDIIILYFELGNKSHLPEKALGIIIQARTKYRSVTFSDYPIRCSNGATFLINTKKLNHPQDFKAVTCGKLNDVCVRFVRSGAHYGVLLDCWCCVCVRA